MTLEGPGSGPKLGSTGRGCLILGALFCSTITLTFDVMIGWNAARQIRALSYPTTPGVIIKSEVEEQPGDDGSTWQVKVNYRYEVAGQKLVGNQYRYGSWASNDGNAQRTVAALPPGKQVPVYYSPNNPADAVLITGVEGRDLFLAMFMTPFNLIMLGLWYLALAAGKQRLAGGAKIWDDGFQVRVRLTQFEAIVAPLAFAGGAAFVGVFTIGFTNGFNPPLRVMLIVWGLVFGGAAIAYVWRKRKLGTGYSDMVIDLPGRFVTLPRNFGRKAEVVVPLNKIQAIEVERIAKRDSEGSTTYQFEPTMIYIDEDQEPARAKLAQWWTGASAEEFAAWLREKLQLKPAESDAASRT